MDVSWKIVKALVPRLHKAIWQHILPLCTKRHLSDIAFNLSTSTSFVT
jgi:hypothetical protein